MRPIKFTKENIEKVFKTFESYDGFELEINEGDDVISRLHAKISTSMYNFGVRRSSISRILLRCLPSNWYYYIAVDEDGYPFIMLDGSYIK